MTTHTDDELSRILSFLFRERWDRATDEQRERLIVARRAYLQSVHDINAESDRKLTEASEKFRAESRDVFGSDQTKE